MGIRWSVIVLTGAVLFPMKSWADGATNPPLGISNQGGTASYPVYLLDCEGSPLSCTQAGSTGTITLAASPTFTNLTASGTVTGGKLDISSTDIRFSGLSCAGFTNAGKLTLDGRGVMYCTNDVSSSGSGNPGGSNTQVQFNSSGSFSGSANMTWIDGSSKFSATNVTSSGTVTGAVIDISSRDIRLSASGLSACNKLFTDALGGLQCGIDANSGGTVTSITAGTNLTGGTITSSGTIALTASPSVTSITASSTVTGAQLDISTKDIRFSALDCTPFTNGGVLTALSNGDVVCHNMTASGGSGTVTSITAGTGLSGGTITTSGTISLTTPVTVANGGTGQSSFTSNGVLYGNAASALNVTAQGGTNSVLTASAGAPSFSASPTVTNITATGTVTGANLDVSSGDVRFSGLTARGVALLDGRNVLYASTSPSTTNFIAQSTVTGNNLDITSKDIRLKALSTSSVLLTDANSAISAIQGPANSVLISNAGPVSFNTSPTVTNITGTNTVTGTSAIESGAYAVLRGSNMSNFTKGLTVNSASGSAASDNFTVKGATDINLIHTDAPNDRVGIGVNYPLAKLSVGGHIHTIGTSPTVATNDCGSTAQGTVGAKSTDTSGTVTVGTLTVTSCSITFNGSWTNAPICVASDDTSVIAIKVVTTTTKATFTSVAAMDSDKISYICLGNE